MNRSFFRLVICLAVTLLGGCGETRDKKDGEEAFDAVKVETARLKEQIFQRRIRVQGTVIPVDSTRISARVAGTIDFLKLDKGDKVKKGDILFRTDFKNLENQVEVARHSLKVAEETCTTMRMDIEIAATNRDKALHDYKRSRKLYLSKAVSEANYETCEAAWKNSIALYNKAVAVLNYTLAQVEQAKVNLHIAEKNLADSIITAPYDGIITAKNLDVDEFAGVGVSVLEMEDPDNLEISCRISAIYYEQIPPRSKLVISFNNRKQVQAVSYFRSPNVDALSRTFEVKAQLPKSCDLISGTLCDVDIILAERKGMGIASNAVLPRKGGSYIVFVAEDGHARQIGVQPGFTTNGCTEILNAGKLATRNIIVTGQYFLNDGTPVAVAN
ncbi:MAG: efflux RND transporter periplasmic adaptor subunit [Victivallales bacterium]|nr:efflux RND transporter periplasmic adaptor subunit [Victivallales bacterium]